MFTWFLRPRCVVRARGRVRSRASALASTSRPRRARVTSRQLSSYEQHWTLGSPLDDTLRQRRGALFLATMSRAAWALVTAGQIFRKSNCMSWLLMNTKSEGFRQSILKAEAPRFVQRRFRESTFLIRGLRAVRRKRLSQVKSMTRSFTWFFSVTPFALMDGSRNPASSQEGAKKIVFVLESTFRRRPVATEKRSSVAKAAKARRKGQRARARARQ